MTLASAGPVGIPPLSLDGIEVEAFFGYKTMAKVGIALRSNLRAGLRGDRMLEKIIPGQAPTANSDSVCGHAGHEGRPDVRRWPQSPIDPAGALHFPAIEFREMAIGRPVGKEENSGRIDLMVTIAAKLGDFLGIVAKAAASSSAGPASQTPRSE